MIDDLLILKDKSILFAEDDLISRKEVLEILMMLFDRVYSAKDGEEAYKIYEKQAPNILLTDIKMPKLDGLQFAQKVRKSDYTTPIIVMTSFAEKELLMNATNLSIDGYLVKPTNLEGLTSTLCKAIQRTHKDMGSVPLGENLFYNFSTKELYHGNNIVTLGVKEQELLALLLENRHRTVTKEEIESLLWPMDVVSSSAIKKLILRIRKKIKIDIIVSIRGVGYRLETRKYPR